MPQNPFTLKSNENAIFPINLSLGNSQLKYATVQPLTRFRNGDTTYYVFFSIAGIVPELLIETKSHILTPNEITTLTNQNNFQLISIRSTPALIKLSDENIHILIVDRDMSENSWLLPQGNDSIIMFTQALVLNDNENIQLIQTRDSVFDLSVFPAKNLLPRTNFGSVEMIAGNRPFNRYRIKLSSASASLQTEKIAENKFAIRPVLERKPYISDYFLTIDYVADVAMAFVDGKLVADDFYYGQPWKIGLKKFLDKPLSELVLYLRPLYPDAKFLNDLPSSAIPDFKNNKTYLQLKSVNIAPEYRICLSF
jgi:hypothetical protein